MTYPPPLLFTSAQATFLAFIPYFSAPWSLAGSSLILWAIWFDRKELLKHVHHRMMLAISVFDFFSSLSMLVLGPWAVPSDWEYGRSGRGSLATCQAMGFMLNFMFGSMYYSVFLAVQFTMVLSWEWKERRIAWCLEPLAHLWSTVAPFATGISSIYSDQINPLRILPGWCWFSDNPPLCSEQDPSVDQCRGRRNQTAIGPYYIILFSFSTIVLCMVLIVLKVRRVEERLGRYAIGNSSTGVVRGNEPSFLRTKATSRQALLYIAIFFITYIPLALRWAFDTDADAPNARDFVLALLVKVLTPMQGLFNAIVYFRTTFLSLVKDGKSLAFVRTLPVLGSWIDHRTSSRQLRRSNARSLRWEHVGEQVTIATKVTSSPHVNDHLPCSDIGGEAATVAEETATTPAADVASPPPSMGPNNNNISS